LRPPVLLAVALVVALVVAGGLAAARLGSGRAARTSAPVPRYSGDGGTIPGPPELRPSSRSSDQDIVPAGRARIRVPILEYHYIRVNPDPRDRLGFRLSVTPSDFRSQMNWLAAHAYHPVTMADVRAYFAAQEPLPARSLVLTFDDGYADFFDTALPILRGLGLKAVAYVVPGFLDRPGYMKVDQVQQLDDSGVVEIASHTLSHPDLTKVEASEVNIQLQASKARLEELLGHQVTDFCYPFGRFDERIVAAVAAAGYQTATTEVAGNELGWSARFTWPRVRVEGGETLAEFRLQLGVPEPVVVGTPPRTVLASPVPSGATGPLSP
jgi:peptidoglycan/xylan/chitin deacetylase (PgdA/CDA1 family)